MKESSYYSSQGSFFKNGSQDEYFSIVEIREEIRSSALNLSVILDQLPLPVFIYDLKGNIIDCNNSFEDILGYEKKDLLGKNWLIIKILPFIQRSRAKIIMEKNALGMQSGPDKYEFVTKNGQIVNVEVFTSLIDINNHKLILASVYDYERHFSRENNLKKNQKNLESMIGEIYRQIEKNLQIVSSLMNLQKAYMSNKKDVELLQDTHNRIKSIRKAYEKLHHSPKLTSINFSEYVKSIISGLLSTYSPEPGNITLNMELDEVFIDLDTAIPLGMIISELVSNSFLHAFSTHKAGEINLKFQKSPDQFLLKVSDNGKGLSKDFDFNRVQSLGLRLVKSLVSQIDGTIQLQLAPGTHFLVEVPRK